ncbi:MAG TPA: fibronectin type III domain-containing protein [Methanomicrobia archaeon]|nr:fibronectin type III domain-containing protein [Methanomicrobia archaeon]
MMMHPAIALVCCMLLLSTGPLEAPDDLEVTLVDSEAHLTWTDPNDNEDGFWLYRDGMRYRQLPPGTTSFIDDISGGNRRTYQVAAFNESGESDLSNKVNVRAEGVPSQFIKYGIPLLLIALVAVFLLDRHSKKKDLEALEEGADEQVSDTGQ